MKVLNVNMSLDAVTGGGTSERTFQMSRFLAKNGVDCTVLTTDVGLTQERIAQLKPAKVVALKCVNRRFYLPAFSYRKVKQLVEEADIIHFMNHWTFINAFVYWIVRKLNKPYVVCPAGTLRIVGRSKKIKQLYNRIVGKKIVANADACIAVTPDENPLFGEYGVDSGNVIVIPNGIDEESYNKCDVEMFRRKSGLGNWPFILFVGRLNHIKGPDLLVEAFCKIRESVEDYHLVMIGPDEGMLDGLKEMAIKFQMEDRIHFLGYAGGEDKVSAYHGADLHVIPSRREAMSIVVLEAGICSTPVLLTDECGFDEVEQAGGGAVVRPSPEAIAGSLKQLLSDPDKLKLKGENLRKFVEESYTWNVIVNKYLDLYNRIISERNV